MEKLYNVYANSEKTAHQVVVESLNVPNDFDFDIINSSDVDFVDANNEDYFNFLKSE